MGEELGYGDADDVGVGDVVGSVGEGEAEGFDYCVEVSLEGVSLCACMVYEWGRSTLRCCGRRL